MAFGGTVAFSVLFDAPKRAYFHCGLVGALGWISYKLMLYMGLTGFTATIVASIVITLASMLLSMKVEIPTTVFLITGIFCIVPGSYIYYTTYNIFTGNSNLFFFYLEETIKTAIAISLGITFVYAFAPKIFSLKKSK